MIVLYIVLAIVILLCMVLIHEFGHYCAGKLLHFKITEFSVGFGFPIISKTNKKTGEKFSLRLFPLGGYCSFYGEDEDNPNSPDAFNNQKPWKRIIVFLAGVTFNFITAIIFSWILLSTIGYDVPQVARNVQYAGGVQAAEAVLDANAQNVQGWQNAQGVASQYVGGGYEILEQDGQVVVRPVNEFAEGEVITHINGKKIDFAFGENFVPMVNAAKTDAIRKYLVALGLENNVIPAEKLDEVRTFIQKIASGEEFEYTLPQNSGAQSEEQEEGPQGSQQDEGQSGQQQEEQPGQQPDGSQNKQTISIQFFEATVRVGKNSKTRTVYLFPYLDSTTRKNAQGEDEVVSILTVGTGLETPEDGLPVTKAYVYTAGEGFCRSFEMAFGWGWAVLKGLWQLITFQVDFSQAGGTIATISMMAQMAQQSLSTVLVFIPLIAANLAVFNILPFPALDGAHVLFTLIEWVRGKPINRKVESMIHFVGICILFGFVILIDLLHFIL